MYVVVLIAEVVVSSIVVVDSIVVVFPGIGMSIVELYVEYTVVE